MSDTIDLLEAIGRDASLRHASSDALAAALDRADADHGLRAAVVSGDVAALAVQAGKTYMHTTQVTQHPGDDEHVPPGKHDHPEKPHRDEPEREPPHAPDTTRH